MTTPIRMALDQASAAVVSTGLVVLCPDTSAILDLVRGPTREQFGLPQAQAAAYFLLTKNPACTLLLSAQVFDELEENLEKVAAETKRGLEKIQAHLQRLQWSAPLIGLQGSPPIVLDAKWLEFGTLAAQSIRAFLASAIVVADDPTIGQRAWDRIRQKLAPSGPGKQEMKDCVIVETLLGTLGRARSSGFNRKAVFLTSNTKDYSGPTGKLHPDLQRDFATAGLDYATTLNQARYLLGFG